MHKDHDAEGPDRTSESEGSAESSATSTSSSGSSGSPAAGSLGADRQRGGDAPTTSPSSQAPTALEPRDALGPWRAALVGVVALILVNASFIAGTVAITPTLSDVLERVRLHTYDAGQHLAVGSLAALLIAGWLRVRPAQRFADPSALVVASALLSLPILGPDLVGFSSRHASPAVATWLRNGMALLVSLGVPVAALIGRWLARPMWRWGGVGTAVALMVLGHFVLTGGDYPGAHVYLAAAAVGLMASAVVSLEIGGCIVPLLRPVPVALLAVVAAVTLVVRPPGRVMLQLLGLDGSVVTPFVSQLYTEQGGAGSQDIPKAWKQWFVPRKNVAAIPPKPTKLPKNGLVIIVSFDSPRADFVENAKGKKDMPNLTRVRKNSLRFAQARTAGS